METVILEIEQEAEALEAQLHDPEFQVQRFAEIPAMSEQLDAAKAKVAKLYTRWEELEALALEPRMISGKNIREKISFPQILMRGSIASRTSRSSRLRLSLLMATSSEFPAQPMALI